MVLEKGFNDRAKYPRETPFHGETLKHVLNSITSPSILMDWFNEGWLPLWRKTAPGRTRQYILDWDENRNSKTQEERMGGKRYSFRQRWKKRYLGPRKFNHLDFF